MKVLVDTSIWSLALRRHKADLSSLQTKQLQLLEELISEGRIELLGVVRQEILSGLREQEQFLKLRIRLRAFPNVDLTAEDYEHAAELSNDCRRRGVAGSSTDFLLCAVALKRKWAIFTSDRDFQYYAKHLPLEFMDIKK
jgi:predicted nucleic acid-binding protein